MAFTFLRTGAESLNLAKKAAAEAELRKESFGKLWRYRMNAGEDAKITFVDGDLSPEWFLLPPRFY